MKILFPLMLAGAAHAAPMDTWSGAGPNACHGDCSQEWAESQLTPAEIAELRAAQIEHPDGQIAFVEDGDVFAWMSYSKEGRPVGYRTHTVALLPDRVETGRGWHMDGWSFVRLDACANWSIIKHDEHMPVFPETSVAETQIGEPRYEAPRAARVVGTAPVIASVAPTLVSFFSEEPVDPVEVLSVSDSVAVAPVPLGDSVQYLLFGLVAGLLLFPSMGPRQ